MNILALLEHFVRYSAENIGGKASINQQTFQSQCKTRHGTFCPQCFYNGDSYLVKTKFKQILVEFQFSL